MEKLSIFCKNQINLKKENIQMMCLCINISILFSDEIKQHPIIKLVNYYFYVFFYSIYVINTNYLGSILYLRYYDYNLIEFPNFSSFPLILFLILSFFLNFKWHIYKLFIKLFEFIFVIPFFLLLFLLNLSYT